VELVHTAEFGSEHEAFLRERQVKGWPRAKKEALIRGDFDSLVRLSKSQSSGDSDRRHPDHDKADQSEPAEG